jgi:hypothetical protein
MRAQPETRRNRPLTDVLDAVARLDQALALRSPLRRRSQIQAAAAAVLEQLSLLADEDLLALDKRVRSWSEYIHWGHGANLPRGFVATDPETVRAAAAAASLAASGFVREQACRSLASFLPWSVNLLAIRTGDWVQQVRSAALDGLREIEPQELVAHLALVSHLTRGRSRADQLSAIVERTLRTDAGLAALHGARCLPADVGTRRTAWTLLLAWNQETVRTELAAAARDMDPWLRSWAAREARRREVSRAVRLGVSSVLRQDPVGRLRAQALQLAIDESSVDELDLAPALSDSSSAVRSLAHAHMRATGVDIAAIYRSRVASDPTVGDLLGLGEVGAKEDAGAITPSLHSDRPGHRRAALIATVMLLDRDAVPIAAEMLSDPSPRVARTATRLLSRRPLPDDLIGELQTQASGSATTGPRRRAVTLLRPYPWRWLLAILRNWPTADDEMAHFLAAELAEWHKRSARVGIGPPAAYATEIRERIQGLGEQSARAIEFVLRTSAPPR